MGFIRTGPETTPTLFTPPGSCVSRPAAASMGVMLSASSITGAPNSSVSGVMAGITSPLDLTMSSVSVSYSSTRSSKLRPPHLRQRTPSPASPHLRQMCSRRAWQSSRCSSGTSAHQTKRPMPPSRFL